MRRHAWLVLALLLLAGNVRADAQSRAACPCAEIARGDAASVAGSADEAPIDLNQASEEALVSLPGIGPARARAILAYRAERGGFRSVSQLLHIRGIGRALLRKLRPRVTVGVAELAPPGSRGATSGG